MRIKFERPNRDIIQTLLGLTKSVRYAGEASMDVSIVDVVYMDITGRLAGLEVRHSAMGDCGVSVTYLPGYRYPCAYTEGKNLYGDAVLWVFSGYAEVTPHALLCGEDERIG